MKGSVSDDGTCKKSSYQRFSSILKSYTTIPVFALPGIDDWKKCKDPSEALQTWRNYFTYDFDKYWFKDPSMVTRKYGRSEIFSYLHKGILYVGLRLAEESMESYYSQALNYDAADENLNWVKSQTKTYEDQFRVLVVLGDSGFDDNTKDFFSRLSDLVETLATPTVYMYASEQTAVYNNFLDHIILVQVHESTSPFMKVHLYESSVTFQQ